MTKQQIIDREIDKKNRNFANTASNLAKAKKESDFWGSPRGVINKLPEAMGDTLRKGAKLVGFKKGGKVKKTGPALVHKGERVLNIKQTKRFEQAKKQYFGIKKYGKN